MPVPYLCAKIDVTVVPYKNDQASKKEQVARMFNNISRRYDFLNRFLSLGVDVYWRKRAIRLLAEAKPQLILDVATGTGDLAIAALKLKPKKIIGVDISVGMLDIGRAKLKRRGLDQIEMIEADSENLPFEENKFDAAIVAFGVRNFENLDRGLAEICRVLRPGARLVVLEFSRPRKFPMKQLYSFYFTAILPRLGRWMSRDATAYTYLPDSVNAFPDGEDFLKRLQQNGFKNTACYPLTFGISSLYVGVK